MLPSFWITLVCVHFEQFTHLFVMLWTQFDIAIMIIGSLLHFPALEEQDQIHMWINGFFHVFNEDRLGKTLSLEG
jgi:hypothetical protein